MGALVPVAVALVAEEPAGALEVVELMALEVEALGALEVEA